MSTRAARERRLVAVLSLTLLGLAGVIAAVTVHDRRAVVEAVVVAPAPAAVSRLAIERPEREALLLERAAGGDWRLVAPCAIDANDARVAPLLDALAGARLDYVADDVDLAAAGLDAPLATVRLDGTAVALGGPDLGGERRYALVDGRVALVPEWTLSLVEGGLSALAEPAPFPSPPTRLRRLDDGEAAAELDPAPWGELGASQVVTWPLPDAPTTTRSARLEATFASGETRVVELVGNASWNAVPTDDGACARLFADVDLPPDAYR